MLRDERKSDEACEQGADEIAIGDLVDRASLRRAAEGVDGVYHLNPAFAPNETELGVAMVESAKEAGVRKFLFSSAIHPSLTKLANHCAKLPEQEALYESGMEFTVL